eukprot:3931096-Pyramimonas_sp.AAC.3
MPSVSYRIAAQTPTWYTILVVSALHESCPGLIVTKRTYQTLMTTKCRELGISDTVDPVILLGLPYRVYPAHSELCGHKGLVGALSDDQTRTGLMQRGNLYSVHPGC